MTEVQSYLWDFSSVPLFINDLNVRFQLNDMNGSSTKFEFVFCDLCPTNIDEWLNSDGTLSSNVHIATVNSNPAKLNVKLLWDKNSRIISIAEDTTLTLDYDIIPVKAVFLRVKSTGYVLGYCVHNVAFDISNKVKFEKDTILWSIQDG